MNRKLSPFSFSTACACLKAWQNAIDVYMAADGAVEAILCASPPQAWIMCSLSPSLYVPHHQCKLLIPHEQMPGALLFITHPQAHTMNVFYHKVVLKMKRDEECYD